MHADNDIFPPLSYSSHIVLFLTYSITAQRYYRKTNNEINEQLSSGPEFID